ncbi:EthD domain-containing protein [Williamsia limnetica]|nr:EthD domain-containing protein [Williamsia limnetica]
MEKVMLAVRGPVPSAKWCSDLREQGAKIGFGGVAINVRDNLVSGSKMTLTTLDPPIVAVVSVWTEQSYGQSVAELIDLLDSSFGLISAYLVTESVPLPVPRVDPGERTPGLANIAFLRRPVDLDEATWRRRWHLDHTPVAIETQATFGYVQNTVVRSLTPDAPTVDAIVEEFFPIEAVHDVHAFFGAADDEELTDRMTRMLASTGAFGADQNIDTVPTSHYLYRDPFVR